MDGSSGHGKVCKKNIHNKIKIVLYSMEANKAIDAKIRIHIGWLTRLCSVAWRHDAREICRELCVLEFCILLGFKSASLDELRLELFELLR